MPTITRRFEFDAGHRVLGHEGKCRHLHGHRYVAEVTVRAAALDSLGRVVDFSVIKEKVGKWIDDNWDHNILLHRDDPLLNVGEYDHAEIFEKEPYIMPHQDNPTAENMAQVLFRSANDLLEVEGGLCVIGVRLFETPNCWADYPDK